MPYNTLAELLASRNEREPAPHQQFVSPWFEALPRANQATDFPERKSPWAPWQGPGGFVPPPYATGFQAPDGSYVYAGGPVPPFMPPQGFYGAQHPSHVFDTIKQFQVGRLRKA